MGRNGTSRSLINVGTLAYDQGDFPVARERALESLAILRELGDRFGTIPPLNLLGDIECDQRDYASAQSLFSESVTIGRELGDRRGMAISLEGLAAVIAGLSDSLRAARIWGAANQLREEVGSPIAPNEQPQYDRRVALA